MQGGTPLQPNPLSTGSASKLRRPVLFVGAIVVALAIVAGLVQAATRPAPLLVPAADTLAVGTASQTQTIAVRGTVHSQSSIHLSFGTGGTLSQLQVHVGSHVHRGQILATLKNGTEQSQVAEAQAAVTAAQAQVASAQAAVASSQGQVTAAQGQAGQAQAHLQQVVQGPTAATKAADAARVQEAQTALQTATAAYTEEQKVAADRTSQEAQVVAAENAVSQAQAALSTAVANRQSGSAAAQQQIASAQQALATAQKNLQADQAAYGSITLSQVQAAKKTYLQELSDFQSWQQGPFGGQNPYAAPLQADQAIYQGLSQGYTTLQQAQQNAKSAQAALAQAQAALTGSNTSITQAQANYRAAQKSLAQAKALYADRTQANAALTAAKNGVVSATAALNAAQAAYQAAIQPPTSATIHAAQAGVQAAQGGVQTAQGGVQTAQAGVTAAQAGVKTAQAALAAAEVALRHTILKAPATGIITASPDKVGDSVSLGAPVFTLDVPALQIDLAVSEAQMHAISLGDSVTVSFPELPGKTFRGHVFQVYPTPIAGNGGEYRVLATVNASTSQVKPGMTGNAIIHLGASAHSILIPTNALQHVNGVTGVYLVTKTLAPRSKVNPALPQNVRFQPVTIGIQGPRHVQIVHGLKPGVHVVLGEAKFFN